MIIISDGFHLTNLKTAKNGFGGIHKAICIDGDREVVLERIHNSNDKIVDILKEVKQEFIIIITITLKQKQ